MANSSTREVDIKPTSQALNRSLWVVQGLLFLLFAGGAVWKVVTPLATISAMMPWTGQVSPAFFYFTAALDLAGGVGVLLPSLTRIVPGLAVLAAFGCAALQVSAVVFHFSRDEAADTPFNFVLIALCLFVAWGRRKAPIAVPA